MKLFTVGEANELLVEIIPKVESIQKLHKNIGRLKETVSAAAAGAKLGGGGAKSASVYVNSLVEIGRLTTEVNDLGVQIKDYSRGLIDFPTMRGDRMVLLCWQIGEENKIEWWHDIESGFAGRKRL